VRRLWAKLWAILKIAGRWLGPALIFLAALLFLFPPMPFADPSRSAALAGAVVTAIACSIMRTPERRTQRKIFAACALIAFAFTGWRHWEESRGYHEQTVSFDNGGVHLVGTLFLPERAGKVPGLVLLPGSGRTQRSLFRGYAAHFAQAGYAVLIYDKRGTGESSGKNEAECFTCVDTDLEPLASDASAGLSFLASRPEVRAEATGFAGLSEGGLFAPRAAALNGHAAFMLIISGAATTLYEIARFQNPSDPELAEMRRARIADFDPMPSLHLLNIPGLWVMGGRDALVPNSASVRNLESLRQLGKPYQYRLIPGAWHVMIVGPKAAVLDTIDTWLAQVTAMQH
jgi:uncharacterized protein